MKTTALLGGCLSAKRTHPHVAVRVFELIRWVEHGAYLPILAGGYARVPRPRPRRHSAARTDLARSHAGSAARARRSTVPLVS